MALLDTLLRARRAYRFAKRPPAARGLLAMALTALATKLIRRFVAKRR